MASCRRCLAFAPAGEAMIASSIVATTKAGDTACIVAADAPLPFVIVCSFIVGTSSSVASTVRYLRKAKRCHWIRVNHTHHAHGDTVCANQRHALPVRACVLLRDRNVPCRTVGRARFIRRVVERCACLCTRHVTGAAATPADEASHANDAHNDDCKCPKQHQHVGLALVAIRGARLLCTGAPVWTDAMHE